MKHRASILSLILVLTLAFSACAGPVTPVNPTESGELSVPTNPAASTDAQGTEADTPADPTGKATIPSDFTVPDPTDSTFSFPSKDDFGTPETAGSDLTPLSSSPGELTARYTAASVATQSPDEAFCRAQYALAAALLQYTYTHRDSKGTNLLLSPISIVSALGMTATGASGETLRQMEQLFGMSSADLNRVLATYRDSLQQNDDASCLLANSIWIREEFREYVRAPYLQDVVTYFQASVFARPFDSDTVTLLNRWVQDKTNGLIQKLLDKLTPSDVMLLINALCFDAKWADQFDPMFTTSQTFHGESGDSTVSMMHGDAHIYLSSENAIGFAKPYSGYGYYFVALLPRQGVSIDDFIQSLDADAFLDLKDSMKYGQVYVDVPKFSYDCSFSLNEVLQSMGISDAFDPKEADFSRMSDVGLCLSDVIHKTRIEMDEGGTRAAAVTSVTVVTTGMPSDPKTVTLDRPFVYAIVDTDSCLPLFIGAITDLNE